MGLNVVELKEQASRCTVLYVEDDELIREQTKSFLLRFFTSIDTAEDGAQGLERYKKKDYDLVITDINMPNMNGIEMIQEIKAIYEDQDIIVTSAYNDSENLMKLINLNVTRFVLKPFNNKQFLTTVYHVIKHLNLIRDMQELEEKSLQDAKLSQHIFDILDTGILVLTNYEITLVNQSFLHIYDFKDIETLKLEMPEIGSLFEIYGTWNRVYSNKEVVEKIANNPHTEERVKIMTKGEIHEYLLRLSYLEDTHQHILTFHDITSIFSDARTDNHTGLPNKDAFLEQLELIANTHPSFDLLLVKIKSYNNLLKWYGSKETLSIEKESAEILKQVVQESNSHAFIAYLQTNQFVVIDTKIDDDIVKVVMQQRFQHDLKLHPEHLLIQKDFSLALKAHKVTIDNFGSTIECESQIDYEFEQF